MRVGFLIASLHTGGAQRQLSILASGLRHRGHEVTVYVLRRGGLFRPVLEREGVQVHPAVGTPVPGVAVVRRLWDDLRRGRIDVLYSYLATANVLSALVPSSRAIPRVWGLRMTRTDLRRYGWFHRIVFGLERQPRLWGDLLITNAAAIREELLAAGAPSERVVVVRNGLEADRFRFSAKGRARWRDRWNLGPDVPVIGIVGRFDVMKGHEVFLDAARRISAIDSSVRFLCIGSGSRRQTRTLRRLVDRMGIADRILWEPSTAHVEEVLSAIDLLCSASIFGEGFPNVVAEAMLCGTPCVVTAIGDAPGLVRSPDLLVPAADPDALAAACLQRLRQGREARPDGIDDDVRERFSVERLVGETERILESVVGGTGERESLECTRG